MKLPRWLMIGMLTTSVLSVLAAAGWWWVTWPERTAREFAALVVAGRWEQANSLVVAEGDIPPHVDRVLAKPPKLRELRDALGQLCHGARG